jgi:hypothetical protein
VIEKDDALIALDFMMFPKLEVEDG